MDTSYSPVLLAASFWLTFCCWIAISIWEGRGRQAKHTTPEGRKNDLLCFFGVGTTGVFALACKGLFPSINLYDTAVLFWTGIGLTWIGMGLRHMAVVALGKYHVMTIYAEPRQPVITSGPYKYIRHPSYLGALIAILGIALATNSLPGSLVLIAVTTTTLVLRIRTEDRYLAEQMSDAYKEYMRHTYRLVPFMW